MTAAAAFFDLDKTLIEGSSGVAFARVAYRAGLIDRRTLLGDMRAGLRYRLHGSTDEASEAIRVRILDAIAGTPVRRLQRLGAEVLAGILPRVYPQMLAEAYEHQDAGREVFIVTAASHEMAQLLAQVLALDGAIGTRSQIRNGIYTGEPEGPFTYREGKAEAIRRVAGERGFDLAASFAYSDSESDLPMLDLVGHPVAVNPDAELARIARERAWRVIHFDKLGRRLRIGAAAGGLALLGGAGGYVGGRVRRRSRARRIAVRWPGG